MRHKRVIKKAAMLPFLLHRINFVVTYLGTALSFLFV